MLFLLLKVFEMCTNILIQENCSLQGSLNKVRCFHKQDSKEIEVMMAFAVYQSVINKGTPHICVMRLIPTSSNENTNILPALIWCYLSTSDWCLIRWGFKKILVRSPFLLPSFLSLYPFLHHFILSFLLSNSGKNGCQ